MDIVNSIENDNGDNKIQTILTMLKKQVDQYDTTKKNKKSKGELTRDQRIQQLLMEEKHLSAQFQKIRSDIERYERKYERILRKKVKQMRMQIREDHKKLKEMKQKYFELDSQIDKKCPKSEKTEKKKSEETSKSLEVQTLASKLKQKDIPLSSKIKIKIKRNVRSCRREIHFVHNIDEQNAFTNLVKIVKPMVLNNRECKIILEKLTEEQINKYIDQKRSDQPAIKDKPITQDCLEEINKSIVCPNWQIKIPRSIFEESQKESRKFDLNVPSCSKEVI